MKTLIINRDWREIEFSQSLREILPENQKELTERELRESEEVAFAMLTLGWKAFEEMHDGAIVYFYDETKIHPRIEREEYGGENLIWLAGQGELEWGYCCTYDPTGCMDFEDDNETGYDATSDDYQPMVSESEFVFAERIIEGPAIQMNKILEERKDKYLEQLSDYAGLKVKIFFDMCSLTEEWQKESFLYMYGNTCIPKECILPIAKYLREDFILNTLKTIRRNTNKKDTSEIHSYAAQVLLKGISDALGKEIESLQ